MKSISMRMCRHHESWTRAVLLLNLVCSPLAGCSTLKPSREPVAPASPALAFRHVTVVDVANGRLVPDQTVVIVGARIQTVGPTAAGRVPERARVVDARGKYLIPGLWDMHSHPVDHMDFAYPLFIANGVTGIRNASTWVPIDSMRRWQVRILTGTRVGPPRQLLTGRSLDDQTVGIGSNMVTIGIRTPAEGRHAVDSLRDAGADFIKVHNLRVPAVYFAIAAEARRVGIPFGGHLPEGVTAIQASDSGQRALDHEYSLPGECVGDSATVARCTPVVARLRRNATWLVPTLSPRGGADIAARLRYLPDSVSRRFWPDDTGGQSPSAVITRRSRAATEANGPGGGLLTVLQSSGGESLVLAGTDVGAAAGMAFMLMPGFSVHDQLAALVSAGLSSAGALRAATLNPAEFIHATDSLGTVAAGKLADLVLLDADPLADIRNTTKISAVIANGRYFGRAALDSLLAELEQAGDARWR